MKVIVTGGHPDPHRCQDRIWDLEHKGRLSLGTVLECECGTWWRLQHKLQWWRVFGRWSLSYRNTSLYWVRVRRREGER